MKALKQFAEGIFTPLEGYRLLRKHPSLFWWALAPWSVTLCCVGGFLLWAWLNLGALSWKILQWLPFGPTLHQAVRFAKDDSWYRRWFLELGWGGLTLLVKIGVLFTASLIGLLLALIVAAFLWELLAEKSAAALRGSVATLNEGPWLQRALRSSLREAVKALILLLGPIVLWLIALIPVIGPIIGLMTAPFLTAGLFGFNTADYIMSVEEAALKTRFRWAVRWQPYLLGVGLIAYFPPMSVLFFPLLVPGVTKKYVITNR